MSYRFVALAVLALLIVPAVYPAFAASMPP